MIYRQIHVFSQVEFGPGALRYSLMYYSGSIHRPLLAFSDTANMSNAAAWKKVENNFYHQRTGEDDHSVFYSLWWVDNNAGVFLTYLQHNLSFQSGSDSLTSFAG